MPASMIYSNRQRKARESMTNEEAIKILNTVLFFGKCDCLREEIEECLKMAIKALKRTSWVPITYREMTEEEKEYFEAEFDEADDEAKILDCILPEIDEEVFISYRGSVYMDILKNDRGIVYFEDADIEDVDAWMPLPEPYKAEGEGDDVCNNDCEHCDWVTCPKMEEETETITVSKGCLKARKGRFVVYDVEYLKSHIEQEAAIYGNVSAIEALKKSDWIPSSERLPEDGDTYLVTIEYNGEVIGVDAASYSPVDGYIDGHWDTFEDWKEDDDTCYHVTAWMPLPEEYKKGGDV